MQLLFKLALIMLTLVLAGIMISAQERDRSKIPERYRWNTSDIYPSDAAWQEAKQKLVAELPQVSKYRSLLASSAPQLWECLDMVSRLTKELARLSTYASLNLDQDTRVQSYLAMQQEMSQISSSFGAATAFIEPEILKMDTAKVQSFLQGEPKLAVYRHYLDDILRRKAHTGTEGEEKIIAEAGLMADSPSSIHDVFSDADFPFPELKLSDGKIAKLDSAGFSLHRASAIREDRERVFRAFMGRLNDYRRTFGAQLNAQVRQDLFYVKARKYNSCLESALDSNNIPTSVYSSLVDNVNRQLGTFHRYLKLRQRILGVDQLHYYDLYAPLVPSADLRYSVEEAEKRVQAALKPLGEDYVSTVRNAFGGRWIDFYPTEAKRSGAYSNGAAYDVHPYVLLNYNGKYDDVSTLAHELGHTMHSHLSNKTQPYPTSQYPIFVAEVASTFNEALLLDYMLNQIKDDKVRLSLLGNYLEGIKGTVFRQTQFAEFELRIHEMVEKGTPLTGDALNEVYKKLVRKYYGHDKGICVVDDEIQAEWMFIPHFYYNFYVYQYATAFTASASLSESVISGDKSATRKYLEFLCSGGTDYPIELLKKAGVDMTTAAPFDLTMRKMNRVMDEMERILSEASSGSKR
ncbi:MAG TPA: oligoendopeptidase F [Acidobacteriota bacterium]|nr:oligoendopeptidase F [Acidobacteriota bacterium]